MGWGSLFLFAFSLYLSRSVRGFFVADLGIDDKKKAHKHAQHGVPCPPINKRALFLRACVEGSVSVRNAYDLRTYAHTRGKVSRSPRDGRGSR